MEAATPTAADDLRGWRKGGIGADSRGEKKQNAKEKAYGTVAVVASHERAKGGSRASIHLLSCTRRCRGFLTYPFEYLPNAAAGAGAAAAFE
eukprot:scaffold22586_cov138-Cylindrotheca_fusiformis.AAC.44